MCLLIPGQKNRAPLIAMTLYPSVSEVLCSLPKKIKQHCQL